MPASKSAAPIAPESRSPGLIADGGAEAKLLPEQICPNCGHRLSEFDETAPSRAERLAARVADGIGTWWFLLGVLALISAWIAGNLILGPIHPYPATMLSGLGAILATVAALEGPVILLSQRRAAVRDRARAREAFRVAANTETDLHEIRNTLRYIDSPQPADQHPRSST